MIKNSEAFVILLIKTFHSAWKENESLVSVSNIFKVCAEKR